MCFGLVVGCLFVCLFVCLAFFLILVVAAVPVVVFAALVSVNVTDVVVFCYR